MIEEIEKKIIYKKNLDDEEVKLFLDFIILSVRKIVDDDMFINKCDTVQGLVGRYLNKLGITNYPCVTNKCVMPNVVGHSFIVATINNSNYIIDPAFIQFAFLDFNELYINNLRIKSKSPFDYALKINKNMTKELVTHGYIKLTEQSAYWYGNSFYYTLTNIKDDYKFKDISGNLYVKSFLKGKERLHKYDYPEIFDFNFEKTR